MLNDKVFCVYVYEQMQRDRQNNEKQYFETKKTKIDFDPEIGDFNLI